MTATNATTRTTNRRSPGYAWTKRTLDILGSIVGLLVTSPILLACMVWVWSRDGASPLYRQWRVGRDGRLFELYKVRTMKQTAEHGGVQFSVRDDQRVLPGCRWMRRSHVDELPQLVHILSGRMSLVGPRPERPEVMEQLRHALPRFTQRLKAKPGLTGLAQIRNGYSNDLAGMRRKLAMDLCYLRTRSVSRELMLIASTIPRLWDRAAC